MLRLPRLRYLRPARPREAAAMMEDLGPRAMLVAGGTDLYPKLKRRQFSADTLVGLGHLRELSRVDGDRIGALVTLAEAARLPAPSGYADAAGLVSSPPLRNAGTIGGNLCVDTRCNYYDMTYEWRRSVGFCMKKDGDICLVAPSSPRCWAVSSSDTAPVAIALGASVVLAGPDGDRELAVAGLYRDDGIDYLAKRPHEVLTTLVLPRPAGIRTAYVKLRRRGSIDFPIAGAAVAMRMEGDLVEWARVVLAGVGSHPVEADLAGAFLAGKPASAEVAAEAAELAARPAKPLDNTDLNHFWRKRMVRVVVEEAIAKAAAAEPR